MQTYDFERGGLSIRCRLCGRVSHHIRDVDERYCGYCHIFHDEAHELLLTLIKGTQEQKK